MFSFPVATANTTRKLLCSGQVMVRSVLRTNECYPWVSATDRRSYGCTTVVCATEKESVSAAISKLHQVINTYQKENYQMTVPSRFRKEMIKATDKNQDGMISVEEMEAVLKQIGAGEQLTHEEIEQIMAEAGVTKGVNAVPIDQFLKFFENTN
mmetsp:Transcript_28046/g.40132  ORF Transcript_28046/g.40132 Transcript_28046/m.40132 type:complete len:154 (+) Transcript_28046:170-631(+)